jgi:hypothetical protein
MTSYQLGNLFVDIGWGFVVLMVLSMVASSTVFSMWERSHWLTMVLWAIAASLGEIGFLLKHEWLTASVLPLVVLVITRDWWNPKRKKVSKLIGEKAKAIRRRLVKTMRQLKPRPLRIPHPVPNA